MAYTTSYDGTNSGLQVGQNPGHITTQFLQSEASLNQACLRDLRTTNPHHDKDRIQNTNGGLLKDSYCWIFDSEEFQQWQENQSNCLLWIRGDPGKGKTMLLCGVIEELTQSFGGTANVSFFFCQATDVRINNATAVLRGLIYSLVKMQPSLLSHVKSQYDHAGKALFEDINAWNALSRIFTDILKDPILQSTYLIIDALDECTTGLPSLLDLITQVSSDYPQIKWIVSSRNWPNIEERLDTTHTAPISLELNEVSVSEAVSRFIRYRVHHLAKVKKYSDDTRHTICRHLSSKSQGTFLWVALVCQELDRTPRRHALKKLEAFPPGLDALYDRMIDQVRSSEDAEPCKRILAVMSIVYRPVAFDELASLVELPDDLSYDSETLSEVIATCGSFLTVSEKTINFVHQIWDPTTGQSVLTLEGHSGPVFSIAWSHDRSRIASASFDKTVRIWHLATGKRVSTFKRYWDWVTLIAWLQDGKRLALASGGKTITIWDSTTGRSVSTLEGHSGPVCSTAWSPDGSRVASASDDKTIRIWDPTTGQRLSTLEGHSGSVILIVWSPDGSRLASASDDKTVKIWDPTACQSLSTILTSSTGFLQFDELNSNRLHTSIGTFDISLIATAMPKSHTRISLPERYRYGLSDDSCWITFNGVNLLWLPTEYRPVSSCLFAIFATKLAIGCSSGRVTFLVLTEHNPLTGL
ncbi:NACHT nucleoside triphosphatase [Penicillium brevicompactum]|uniref:NACHT nucleoside triphosphatase n=1 Tax=Penicillium brevicompactum TaxID=5074 RepID=UPI00254223C6|nr:NACHT nucleoside triphosphatase [Penicillium brevicompactum]KAJ5337402.1 NACHT nucleoside triphosphatase [Penicillium brevicompactum]